MSNSIEKINIQLDDEAVKIVPPEIEKIKWIRLEARKLQDFDRNLCEKDAIILVKNRLREAEKIERNRKKEAKKAEKEAKKEAEKEAKKEINDVLRLLILEDEKFFKKPEKRIIPNLDDKYEWIHFDSDIRLFEGEKDDLMCYIRDNLPRVLARVESGKGLFVKKENGDFSLIKQSDSKPFTDLTFSYGYSGNREPLFPNSFNMPASILTVANKFFFHLSYAKIDFDPANTNNCVFNLWRGYKAEEVKLNKNHAGLKMVLDHLKEVICGGDARMFEYVLHFFKEKFKYPAKKSQTAIVLSGSQGDGKGMFFSFLKERVFGDDLVSLPLGMEAITGKFNANMKGKMLVVVNEISGSKDSFSCNFDKFKSYITDPEIEIEPKGLEKYIIKNFTSYFLCTNHQNGIKIENKDRRYVVIQTGNKYNRNNPACVDPDHYDKWDDIVNNQETANLFYTYCLELEGDYDLRVIPQSNLRTDMIESSKSTAERFYDYVKESLRYGAFGETSIYHEINDVKEETTHIDDEKQEFKMYKGKWTVSADRLYNRFVEWASEENVDKKFIPSKHMFGLVFNRFDGVAVKTSRNVKVKVIDY